VHLERLLRKCGACWNIAAGVGYQRRDALFVYLHQRQHEPAPHRYGMCHGCVRDAAVNAARQTTAPVWSAHLTPGPCASSLCDASSGEAASVLSTSRCIGAACCRSCSCCLWESERTAAGCRTCRSFAVCILLSGLMSCTGGFACLMLSQPHCRQLCGVTFWRGSWHAGVMSGHAAPAPATGQRCTCTTRPLVFTDAMNRRCQA
jgi:hypothetical protein